jgi:hypothetical protein
MKLDDQPWRNRVNIYLHMPPSEMQRKGAPLLTETCELRFNNIKLGTQDLISLVTIYTT